MIELLAAAFLAASPAQVTAEELGRLAVTVGYCSEMGWVSAPDGGAAVVGRFRRENPKASTDQAASEMQRGMDLQVEEIDRARSGVTDRATFLAWAASVERRCDAAAERFPEALLRTDATAAAFAAAIVNVGNKFPE